MMKTKVILKEKILLAGVLALAVLLRVPGVFWGDFSRQDSIIFETDEYQHLDLTVCALQRIDSTLFPDYHPYRLNSPGFSTQLALTGYPLTKYVREDYKLLLIAGRCLSVIYGVLLVWLVFRMGSYMFSSTRAGLAAAAGMAVFDLSVTYSHYAIPEIAYVFWAMLAIFQWIKLVDIFKEGGQSMLRNRYLRTWLSMVFAMGMTLAFKFDFIPCLVLALGAGVLLVKRKITLLQFLGLGFASVAAVLFFFWAGAGFSGEDGTLFKTLGWLVRENHDLIPKDNHYVTNPVMLLAGTIAGIGLPAAMLAVWGAWKAGKSRGSKGLGTLAFFMLLEFLILWNLDALFIRRCLIFMPFAALLCGYGVHCLIAKSSKVGLTLICAAGFYTLLLTAVSQWNFVDDPRFHADAYLNALDLKGKRIYYDPYANPYGPKNNTRPVNAGYLIIHETYYRRFWKSFTTPFKVPECCDEVYHCGSMVNCKFWHSLLRGETDFVLLKKFKPLDWAPERLLYKKYFGTYETFLGDVLIFKKPD